MSTPAHRAAGIDPSMRDWDRVSATLDEVAGRWRELAAGRPGRDQRTAARHLRKLSEYRAQLLAWCRDAAAPRRDAAPSVDDLRGTFTEPYLFLSWTPHDEPVQLRILHTAPPVEPGTVLTAVEVDALGKPLTPQRPGHARHEVHGAVDVWVLPVTMHGDAGVVGRALRWVYLPALDGLEAVWSGGSTVRLRWTWPTGVQQAAVAWSFTGSPGFADVQRRVQREHAEDGIELDVSGEGRCAIAVFTLSADGQAHAAPARATASLGRARPVRYRVVLERHWLTRRVQQASVELQGEPGLSLFGLLAVAGRDEVPLTPEHGRLLLRVPVVELGPEPTRLSLPLHAIEPGTYLRLFLEEPTGSVRLLPPTRDALRLD